MLDQIEEMPTAYKPGEKPEPKVGLNARIPVEMRDALLDAVRLWRLYAMHREDEVDVIDLSYVVRRFIRVGIDQAFAEFGGRPKNEKGWDAIERAVAEKVSKKSQR